MSRTLLTCVLSLFAACSATSAASEFKSLIQKVPRGANAILVIDIDQTLASPLAKAGGWQSRIDQGGADRPLYLPPEADKVVVAAHLDQVRGFERNWEVALMGLKSPMPISLIARAEGGYTDNVNGTSVAWVPSDAYFMEFDQSTLGLIAPADRQAVSRWAARRRLGDAMEISDYLGVAAAAVGQGPHAVLALDATDTVQPHRVRSQLAQSESVQGDKQKLEGLVGLISSLRGVVLKITFTDKAQAVAQIDFAVPVTLNAAVARKLVLDALQTMQMELPGTEDWKCTVNGNSILMTGDLNSDALRRVFSVMEIPTTKFSSLKDENIEAPSGDDMAKNSLAYFKSINTLLKDLKSRAGSSNSDAYWIDRYATKIDRLPILHVDDDLLTFGEKTSETLRIMSGSRKMTNLQGGVASRDSLNQGGGIVDTGYGYGAYNYSTPKARERNAGVARANAAAAGTVTKVQGWTLIDNATLDIRREMTKRYNMEF